jgi:hypothetical protein
LANGVVGLKNPNCEDAKPNKLNGHWEVRRTIYFRARTTRKLNMEKKEREKEKRGVDARALRA